jgi:hypothetical protein
MPKSRAPRGTATKNRRLNQNLQSSRQAHKQALRLATGAFESAMASTWAVAGGIMRSFEQLEGALSKGDFGEREVWKILRCGYPA